MTLADAACHASDWSGVAGPLAIALIVWAIVKYG